jgi:hypothetical protein
LAFAELLAKIDTLCPCSDVLQDIVTEASALFSSDFLEVEVAATTVDATMESATMIVRILDCIIGNS